ncbi:hypothetical protein SD70_02330 [Gordoniibacillus kamchatkensis]|uniref:Uncharacterized protein n=1 Tax=Gordoniibacillus kamchatkensis TaxID=1590651 RepID=A0ABR5ALY5_9BACL|nr:hypothetical protein SD70_02330 [Paenibacillus sp. VKM B-2647]
MPKQNMPPKRYARERDFYENKLKRVMDELDMSYELRYDRWEGAAIDFTTPKGIRRRFERVIDKQTIHYSSDV